MPEFPEVVELGYSVQEVEWVAPSVLKPVFIELTNQRTPSYLKQYSSPALVLPSLV